MLKDEAYDRRDFTIERSVLLDALSAFDDISNPDPDPAIRVALRRLEEIDAVAVLYDDETDIRTVDIQPVLHAALELLVASIADQMRNAPDRDGDGIGCD